MSHELPGDTRPRRTPRRVPLLAASLTAVVTLAACAGSGESAPGPPPTAGLDTGLFLDGALAGEPTVEECTLSGGASTDCYRITVAGYPVGRETGPFCPETTRDGADKGGIWFDGENVYDISGQFVKDLATLYDDDNWRMYDDQGNVLVVETKEEFEAAARPDVDPDLENHCIEGRLEWFEGGIPVTSTVLIPMRPVAAEQTATPRGALGITLDGVRIDEPAPVEQILGAYTIAAFDDCGGHYNPAEGYHLHGAVGCSEVGGASEGDTPAFGYALDGHAVHSPYEPGRGPTDLDECNGHTTTADGYHYHANDAAKNKVVQCLKGQFVESSDEGPGAGGPPGDAPEI